MGGEASQLDLSTQLIFPILYHLYNLYDPAHVAGWNPENPHHLPHVSWVWICTVQILHNLPQRQVKGTITGGHS